jgi:hypothetical protein
VSAEKDVGRETCRIVEVDGESVRVVGGADEWTQGDHEAFAEVVRAVKRRFDAELRCTCSPYFGSCDYSPDCPKHGLTHDLPPGSSDAS